MEGTWVACANLFFLTDEPCSGSKRPPSLSASAGNLRGSKAGLPTEAVLTAKVGGARRDRTDDLLLAKQALSQLSYGPSRYQISVAGDQDDC